MKSPKTLYSRLALITSVTLVVGYFVVYAAYQTFTSPEYQSGAALSSTFLGKIVSNLDEINGRVTTLEGSIAGASVWSKVGNDISYTAGKVGVGATTGNAELDIQSGTKPHWGIYHDSTSEELRFWNGDNRVVIASTGNVGIGTTNPTVPLQVHSTNPSTYFHISNNVTGAAANDGLELSANNDNGSNVWNYENGYLRFATNNLERMRIDGAGNVGIGTTTPSQFTGTNLIVNGTQSIFGLQIGGVNAVRLASNTSSSYVWEVRNAPLILGTNNTEKMRIDGAGNVGIGVTAPTNKFVVDANEHSGPIIAYAYQNYDAFSFLPWTGATYLSSGVYYKNGAWVHDGFGTKNALFAFGGGGALWYASDNSAGSWNVASAVPLWSAAGVLQGVSSKTSKENYESLDFRDILDRIERLPVEKWNYKTEGKGIKHIGPYAEDFRASFGLGESDKSIALIDEAGVALVGVKGLRELVREQEQTIQELRKDVEMLKKTR